MQMLKVMVAYDKDDNEEFDYEIEFINPNKIISIAEYDNNHCVIETDDNEIIVFGDADGIATEWAVCMYRHQT